MKRIEDSIRREVVSLYSSGMSSTDIVETKKMSERTILRMIRESGIPIRGPKWLKEECYPAIIADYRLGLTKRQIRTKHKCANTTIVQVLDSVGEHQKNRSEARQVYGLNQNYFDDIDSSQKAYFLGFLWADGHNNIKHNHVMIRLAEKDICMLEKFKTWLNAKHPIYTYQRKGYRKDFRYVHFNIKNQHLSQSLLRLGMVQNKTRYPVLPKIKSGFQRDFIRGFFDGDGCWYVRKGVGRFQGSISFAGNISFLKEIAAMIEGQTGIKSGVYLTKGSDFYGHISFAGREKMLRFGEWLYRDKDDAFLDRKYQKYFQMTNLVG